MYRSTNKGGKELGRCDILIVSPKKKKTMSTFPDEKGGVEREEIRERKKNLNLFYLLQCSLSATSVIYICIYRYTYVYMTDNARQNRIYLVS